ncbi:MAG: hypothetical protein V1790_04025 [Planctomycetota bacterium]
MNLLFEAAKEVCDFASDRGWRYCVIGGLALQRWGEPRTTLDVDLSLLTGFGHEEEFARPLLEHFKGRILEHVSLLSEIKEEPDMIEKARSLLEVVT